MHPLGGANRERGASLVEFALLAPLIFCLLLGMITGGLALSRKNSMTNAVREGARVGATLDQSDDWADAVVARVLQVASDDLEESQVCVELRKVGDATPLESNSCAPALGSGPSTDEIPVGQCVVKVWAERTSDLEVIFFSRQLTLTSDSLNRYERNGDPPTCG